MRAKDEPAYSSQRRASVVEGRSRKHAARSKEEADSRMQGLLKGWLGLRRIVKIPGLAIAVNLDHL